MNNNAPPTAAAPSPLDLWFSRLGVRPDEKRVTGLLFSNMFMSGIAIGMIRVCAFTLFLDAFGADRLALVAILLAITGTVLTIAIDRGTARMGVGGYIFTVLGTIFAGLVILRSLLGITDSKYVIFFLPLFFEIVYMLFSLQFLAFLSKLFNVRQSKRLSGITRSGEFLAEMVGGLSVALLLKFLTVTDLLLVAALATLAVFGVAAITIRQFRTQLSRTTQDLEEDAASNQLLGMLRLPYVRLISLCYAAYIFAYFFLDVAFYKYASVQFPNERMLAEFLGQFFAVIGIVTLLTMIFVFAPFLRRFGIVAGILAFPVAIGIGSTAVSALEFTGMEITVIFAVMVVTNAMRFILQSAIWRPSVAILFQVLPDRQRSRGTSLIEGVVDPFAGGVAGLVLFVISDRLAWEPKQFLLVLTGLMAVWLGLGFVIRRMYLSHLVVSIQKRKLGELSLQELDNASLNIIKEGIKSPYPAEIFYCLNILEELEHPEITELMKEVIANPNRDVRMDVLRRIARLGIEPLRAHVRKRLDDEHEPAVRGQALKTYAALGGSDVVEQLTPYLMAAHRELRMGALVGILSHSPADSDVQDFLLAMIRSSSDSDRLFAAQSIGEIGSKNFSGFLIELLDDSNPDVVNAAISAAGNVTDERLLAVLVRKLAEPNLQGRTSLALQRYGDSALAELDNAFSAPGTSRQVKRQIVDVVREIGGVPAMEFLLRYIDIDRPELRNQIYLALATLHYQADPDDQYIFVNKLEEEIQQITWLLATMEDLYRDERYRQLTSALGQELDHHRDNMLLLISFLFPSIVMLDTRANIDSKVAELRVFALEVLDNLLTADIKEVVIPVLDDLSVSERLTLLRDRYPQENMSPEERFHQLVEQHFDERFFWTQASLLHLIGQAKAGKHVETVKAALTHREPIVRETASWTLARLDSPEARRLLQARLDDENEAVRAVASELLDALPA